MCLHAYYRFLATRDMAPRARLLIYYMREDGEVVADSLHFAVSGAIQNEVSASNVLWCDYGVMWCNCDVVICIVSRCCATVWCCGLKLLAYGSEGFQCGMVV